MHLKAFQLPKPGLEVTQADIGLALEASRQEPSPALTQSPPPQALQDQAHSQLAPRLQGHYSADHAARISYAAAQVAHQESYKGQPEGFYVSPDKERLAIKYPAGITERRIADLLQQAHANRAPQHTLQASGRLEQSLQGGSISEADNLRRVQSASGSGVLLADAGPNSADPSRPGVVSDTGSKSVWQLIKDDPRHQNNSMSLFNKDASTIGGGIRSLWNDLTKPRELLADAKNQALHTVGQQLQNVDAYSKDTHTSLLGEVFANMTKGQMAQNYGLVNALAPTSLLDVTLATFGAKPTIKGLHGEMQLGIQTLDDFSLLGEKTQLTVKAYQSAYEDAMVAFQKRLDEKNIAPPQGLNFNTWKGNLIDTAARDEMLTFKQFSNMDDLVVNKRLYTPDGIKNYRIPDLLITGERTAIDGTIGLKTLNTPQIQDIFSTGTVDRVILVSPRQQPVIITVEQYLKAKK